MPCQLKFEEGKCGVVTDLDAICTCLREDADVDGDVEVDLVAADGWQDGDEDDGGAVAADEVARLARLAGDAWKVVSYDCHSLIEERVELTLSPLAGGVVLAVDAAGLARGVAAGEGDGKVEEWECALLKGSLCGLWLGDGLSGWGSEDGGSEANDGEDLGVLHFDCWVLVFGV